jgi:hypothetical protein
MSNVGDPAKYAAAIVPADAVRITPTRSIYVGVTGNVTVRMAGDGALVTFPNVPVGVLPVQAIEVLSTGTTASSMVAMW